MKKNLLSALFVASMVSANAATPFKVKQAPEAQSAVSNEIAVVNEAKTAKYNAIATRADGDSTVTTGQFREDYGTYYLGKTTGEGFIKSPATSDVDGCPGTYGFLAVPPYVDFTYQNLTEGNDNSYVWYLSAGNSKEVSTDKNYNYGALKYLDQDYYYSYYYSPVLSVNGGPSTGIATLLKSLSGSLIPWTNGAVDYGFAPYPSAVNNGEKMVQSTITWWTAGEDMCNPTYWTSASKLKELGLTEGTVVGYGQVFEKPISPFVMEGVSGYSRANIKKGAKINATIRKINEKGQIAEVVTTGSYTFEEDIQNVQGTSSNGVTKFTVPVSVLDEFEMETPLVVDYPYVVFISAEWGDTTQFTAFSNQLITAPNDFSADQYYNSGRFGTLTQIKGKTAAGNETTVFPYVSVGFTSGAVSISWWLNVEGYFPYFGYFGGSEVFNNELKDQKGPNYTLTVDTKGGTYSIWAQSNAQADEFMVSDENDDEVASWLKVTASDEVDTEGEDKYDYINFKINVEALPSGVTGRQATLKFSTIGLERSYTITQGENGGVGAVAVEAVAVKTVGGNFEVVVPASVSNVAVYNVAGQKVADVNVTAGANTIDGSALANGVYVLKFNNGYTVKAVK